MKKIPVEVKNSLTWAEITDVYRKQIENGSITLDREKMLNDLECIWRLISQFSIMSSLDTHMKMKLSALAEIIGSVSDSFE